MVMDPETSHHQACSSHGIDCPTFIKSPFDCLPANYVSPRTSNIQRNLSELSLSDLLQLSKQLKYPSITTLRLTVCPEDKLSVSQFFGGAEQRTIDALFVFTRALAHSIEGWMRKLELGVCLGLRDINTLCPAISSSRTLRHLSFANSGLGDVTLQVLSSCLQHCQPLQTLNLSGCALTDASTSVITTIIKGVDPSARSLTQSSRKTTPAKHRAPKYGLQWRQNAILIGKWSPAPDLGESLQSPRSEGDWQTSLRKQMAVGSIRHEVANKAKKSPSAGCLVALDLSCNSFTDALSEELCPLLYKRPPLRALNLRCNQMTRAGAKPLLDVMKDMNILRLVDIRGNKDDSLLGVLENGEHYTTFSTIQFPFWMNPESLDSVTGNSTKSQSNGTPASRSRCAAPSPRSSNMPEKPTKATIISQHAIALKGGAGTQNNNGNKTRAGGLQHNNNNNSPSRTNKTPPKISNASPPRANISPSCSGASVSRAPADQHWGPCGRQKRYYQCSRQGSPYVHCENEDTLDFNDHHTRRFTSTPGKERPASSARISPFRAARPEKTLFFDQNSQKHISPSREQDFDGRFMSPRAPESARESSLWENTVLHEFDMHDASKAPDGLGRRRRTSNSPRRAPSADYNIHRQGYPRERPRQQDSGREYYPIGHPNCGRSCLASEAASRRQSPVIRCHHRCKLLSDVQEQRRIRSQFDSAVEEHGHRPIFHQLMPKSVSLPEDKMELVEWNHFVNKMTSTLLNLKDGLHQLIGPSEGAVAQQAATKLNQMPSSFFRSGMLRLLERSCKVLNSHLTSLTKRHKESMRHVNIENQAPTVNGETPNKKKFSTVVIDQEAVGKQEEQFDKSQKTFRNVKHLGLHNSNQQHRMIYHPNLPALTASKGNTIPQATN